MTATTWRADLVAAHVAILGAQATATPTILRRVYSSRPGAFGETPVAYIADRNENVTHDSGTRTRTILLEVVLVDAFRDNITTGDLLDQLVDLLVDRYDAATQYIPGTIIELTSIRDTDIDVKSAEGTTVFYRGVVMTFGKSAILEGRQ